VGTVPYTFRGRHERRKPRGMTTFLSVEKESNGRGIGSGDGMSRSSYSLLRLESEKSEEGMALVSLSTIRDGAKEK